MVTTWAIPVGVLAGICTVALIFFFWYFPRTWARGDLEDRQRMDLERAERIAAMQQRTAEGGEGGDKDGASVVVEGAPAIPAKPVFKYTPPMY